MEKGDSAARRLGKPSSGLALCFSDSKIILVKTARVLFQPHHVVDVLQPTAVSSLRFQFDHPGIYYGSCAC